MSFLIFPFNGKNFNSNWSKFWEKMQKFQYIIIQIFKKDKFKSERDMVIYILKEIAYVDDRKKILSKYHALHTY